MLNLSDMEIKIYGKGDIKSILEQSQNIFNIPKNLNYFRIKENS